MFIVMLVGGNEALRFFAQLKALHKEVIFLPDEEQFYENTDLFLCFGGPMSPLIRSPAPMMTWSGDDQETLHRVYKTLGVE